MIRAACTIVSLNYLPYARTLCNSFRAIHPAYKFYVLLVDRLPADMDRLSESFELILVEELGIPQFNSFAFKFGILELNTNVKPTLLKSLLARGIDQIIYFDPDILICSPVTHAYEALNDHAIVLTPHCTSPNEKEPYAEVLLLGAGAFNLGFIGVSRSSETTRFLSWWELRCLELGYDERWTGLFVDQKWINLVPCYFNSVQVLKHPGYNVAYWNLHERTLERLQETWIVNGSIELVFFHFSGVDVDGGDRISRHTDQFNLASRPDLAELFSEYRGRLIGNGIRDVNSHQYAFGRFDNRELISKLLRAAFAANLDSFGLTNPFDPNGPFYKWAKKRHLLSATDSIKTYSRKTYNKNDPRIRFVNAALRFALRVMGSDRYTVLMKYFEFASVLRNQKDILGDVRE